jgi:hypothetical protein
LKKLRKILARLNSNYIFSKTTFLLNETFFIIQWEVSVSLMETWSFI